MAVPIETDGGAIRADPNDGDDDVTDDVTTDEPHSDDGEEENPEDKGGNYSQSFIPSVLKQRSHEIPKVSQTNVRAL